MPGFTKRAFVLGQNSIHEALPILPASTSSQGGGDVPSFDPTGPTTGPTIDQPINGESFEQLDAFDPVDFGS